MLMTIRRPHNLLAFLVVLITSLVINPAFAMPGHQMTFYQQSETNHHATAEIPAKDTSVAQANSHHQDMLHCDECSAETIMDTDQCNGDGDNAHCKHCSTCSSSHCQFSALPVLHLAQSHLADKELHQRLLATTPISRLETSLRPPIH